MTPVAIGGTLLLTMKAAVAVAMIMIVATAGIGNETVIGAGTIEIGTTGSGIETIGIVMIGVMIVTVGAGTRCQPAAVQLVLLVRPSRVRRLPRPSPLRQPVNNINNSNKTTRAKTWMPAPPPASTMMRRTRRPTPPACSRNRNEGEPRSWQNTSSSNNNHNNQILVQPMWLQRLLSPLVLPQWRRRQRLRLRCMPPPLPCRLQRQHLQLLHLWLLLPQLRRSSSQEPNLVHPLPPPLQQHCRHQHQQRPLLPHQCSTMMMRRGTKQLLAAVQAGDLVLVEAGRASSASATLP